MADDTLFRAWQRPTVGSDATEQGTGLRRRLKLKLGAALSVSPNDGTDLTDVGPSVALPGPHDVVALGPRAIKRLYPPDGSGDAEGEYCAYLDLSAEDLAWRYTSAPIEAHDSLKPWLAVIAGEEGRELGLDAAGRAWLNRKLTGELDPARSGAWAHVHVHLEPDDPFEASRVLCLRSLPDNANCLAVVVPLYRLVDDRLEHSWKAGSFAGNLPVLKSWRFRTNEAGTFRDLAAALRVGKIPSGLGVTKVSTDLVAGQVLTASAFGLLAPIGVPSPGDVVSAALEAAIEERLAPDPAPGRPVLGPPWYARTWAPEVEGTTWGQTLNFDPRHRAVAALGTRAGIDWQQQIVDAASRRLGQTHFAARLLRDLTTGVELSDRLQARRPGGRDAAGDQVTAAERLAFYGPALRKARTAGGGSALSHLTGPYSPLDAPLLSAAALRLVRRGGTVARALESGAEEWSPGAVVAALNTCPEPPEPVLTGTGREEPRSRMLPHEILPAYFAAAGDAGEFGSSRPDETEVGAFSEWLRTFDTRRDERPPRPCAEIDIRAVVDRLDHAFDPRNVPVDATLSRIFPRPARHDVPFVVDPDLDLPAWAWLRDRAPEWLLPRAELVAPDSVVALRSNGAFLEAFLIGLSQQAVAELRWRGVPCSPTAMPMRTLWQRVRKANDKGVRPDIAHTKDWTLTSDLDDPSHRGGDADMLVILLRSDILRRYPDTVIRLAPTKVGEQVPELSDPAQVHAPAAVGRIAPGLWFIAFEVDPGALADHFLILEETVAAPRFQPPSGPLPGPAVGYEVTDALGVARNAFNGAEYADAAWVRPCRVAIHGSALAYTPAEIGFPP